MKRPTILIYASDRELERLLRFLVEKESAQAVTAAVGSEAMRRAEATLPDLIVLEAARSGEAFALCRRLRAIATFADTPVLMLTDRPEAKYQAFQAGATDVMTKPLDQLEFQYRLRVHLKARLRPMVTEAAIQAGALSLDPVSHSARYQGQEVNLTRSEYTILRFLATRPDQPISTESLLVEALGEPRQLGNPQVVHTHIRNLRRKLESNPSEPQIIRSSRQGYRFHPPTA